MLEKAKSLSGKGRDFKQKTNKSTKKVSIKATFTQLFPRMFHVEFFYNGLFYDLLVPESYIDTPKKKRAIIPLIICQYEKGKSV